MLMQQSTKTLAIMPFLRFCSCSGYQFISIDRYRYSIFLSHSDKPKPLNTPGFARWGGGPGTGDNEGTDGVFRCQKAWGGKRFFLSKRWTQGVHGYAARESNFQENPPELSSPISNGMTSFWPSWGASGLYSSQQLWIQDPVTVDHVTCLWQFGYTGVHLFYYFSSQGKESILCPRVVFKCLALRSYCVY